MLNGSIPESLGDPRFVRILDLRNNSIAGEIPLSISNLQFMQECSLKLNVELRRNYTGSTCGVEIPGKGSLLT